VTPRKLLFFILGFLCFLVGVLAEVGMGFAIPSGGQDAPGVGIRMLGLIDLGLAWSLFLMVLEFAGIARWLSRVQGIVTLILSFLGILGGIILIVLTFTLLILMVSLLVAAPFGTIAYLAIWADFPSAEVRAVLGMIMMMKLLGLVFLAISNPAILKNKGLIILLLFSIGSTFITALLIALVPGFVAAIADVIGALISAILGTIWLVVMLIGAIFAVIRALRSVVPV